MEIARAGAHKSGPKWGREGWDVSAPENRHLSRNGGHRSIEEDETKNI